MEILTQSKSVSVSIIPAIKSVVDDPAKSWVLASKPSTVSKRGSGEDCRGKGASSKGPLVRAQDKRAHAGLKVHIEAAYQKYLLD